MKLKMLLFVGAALVSVVPQLTWAGTECTKERVQKLVERLGYDESANHLDDLKCLADYPAESAGLLIAQLHTVVESKIRPEDDSKHQSSMHVIWSIRALRYITGGMDFTSKTSVPMSKLGKPYWSLLTVRNKKELTFFGTRMSHDTVYLAPRDVQLNVIKKWQDWYAVNGQSFAYKSAKESMDWYF